MKQYIYDEFGNLSEEGEAFDNEITFTGSVTDTSTGLQYMNARYYNPTTGRFLTQDSYTGNPYDPWTQHLYSYCGNNPTNFVDPTGHASESLSELSNKANELLDKYHSIISTSKGYSKISDNWADKDRLNLADKYLKLAKKAYAKAVVVYAEYESILRKFNELKNKLTNEQPVYNHEEDAAAAFLAAEIPNTANDGKERSGYIVQVIGYEVDSNGYIIERDMYAVSSAFTGSKPPLPWLFGTTDFIGLESARACLGIAGMNLLGANITFSMVHTHPSNSSGIPGFSEQDKSFCIDTCGCASVYMGMPGDINGNGVYQLTSSGPVANANGDLLPVTYY